MLREVLFWLDADAARYWTLAWLCFGGTTWAAWRTSGENTTTAPRANKLVFAMGVYATLAAFRWPAWFYPSDLNPDESQTIAGAITLLSNPIYWKSVDGTTHGPVCEFALVVAGWLGAPLNYVTARVMGTMLQATSVLASWGALRFVVGDRIARIACLPALLFWCCVTWDDYVHYSSEVPAIFLLSVGAWLATWALHAGISLRRACLLAGLAGSFLGFIPFAKLQVAPLGLGVGLLACTIIVRRHAGEHRRYLLAALLGGATLPTAAVALYLTIYGLWAHFIPSYVVSAFAYVAVRQHAPIVMPGQFFNFSATEPAFAWFFWGSLCYALFHAQVVAAVPRARALCWALLGIAFYCVFKPGREAAHYLQLLVWPLTLLTGTTLAAAWARKDDGRGARFALVPLLWLGLFAILPQVYHRIVSWHRFVGHLAGHLAQPPPPAAIFLNEQSGPGDTIAMWGWETNLLVATGRPHGTREAHTANLLIDWPLRHYFINRYLRDMERNQPAWFVDAVGPGAFMFDDRNRSGHETVPELRDLIDANYKLVARFENKRVYRLTPRDAP